MTDVEIVQALEFTPDVECALRSLGQPCQNRAEWYVHCLVCGDTNPICGPHKALLEADDRAGVKFGCWRHPWFAHRLSLLVEFVPIGSQR